MPPLHVQFGKLSCSHVVSSNHTTPSVENLWYLEVGHEGLRFNEVDWSNLVSLVLNLHLKQDKKSTPFCVHPKDNLWKEYIKKVHVGNLIIVYLEVQE